ncbi:adenylate cyclase [Gordonia araii NBRC 100433]|uniref:Adenylate cyclase n=1 Tax=Gordonia araii NBRC 100433 TaxID=1073574 RepID=G7H5W6_9ACTN|nr:adenylate/guanylate cyclase domain-containing protein [Gordonia araii]NNG95683.1 adenylate/guanylate cyclase domain-containing protein [Gordonia araii NBRC 100433]GAB11241.1 adenylate cyclase [Gordonia araii NBRC 100433]
MSPADKPAKKSAPAKRAGRTDKAEGSVAKRAAELLARTDSSESAVTLARAARNLVPGVGGAPLGGDERPSDRLARLIEQAHGEQPSAMRELSLATVEMWQSLTRRRSKNAAPRIPDGPMTIMFTDLVSFSTWALRAGDDHVLELIRAVDAATATVVRRRGGQVVKNLGDGTMAVFADAEQAILAAFETITAISAIEIGGYRPQLRAGLHTGTPRPVGDDYLGVDVNIAARVGAAAGAGEVFVSDAVVDEIDNERFVLRRKRFRAKGVPKETVVYSIVPKL